MGDAINGAAGPAAVSTEQAADETGAPANPGATPGQASIPGANSGGDPIKAAAAEAIRKLKIDDQEIDETEVIKVYKDRKGHQKVANQKLQEGLKYRKQAEEFVTAMKDPGKLVHTLQKLGWEPKQIRDVAEKYLAGVLEDEMMDPKDKELKTTKQRLEDYERKEAAAKKADDDRHQETLKKKFADDYSKEFIEALQATKIPPTKSNVGKMAGYIARAANIKMPMTASEAARLVQEDIIQENKHLFSNMTPDQIIKIVGEEGLKKLREFDTSRLKDPNANLQTPTEQGELQRKKDPSVKRMSTAEWRAFNRK